MAQCAWYTSNVADKNGVSEAIQLWDVGHMEMREAQKLGTFCWQTLLDAIFPYPMYVSGELFSYNVSELQCTVNLHTRGSH